MEKVKEQIDLANAGSVKEIKVKKQVKEKQKKRIKKKLSWCDGCEYLCSICNKIFSHKTYLNNHLISIHQTTFEEYRIKHSVEERIREYECKICNKFVLWNRDSIQKHIKRYHLLSLDFYEKTYLENNAMPIDESSTLPVKKWCNKKDRERSEEL